MNDNALSGCHMPNYGHLCQDAPVEPPYVTEVGTAQTLQASALRDLWHNTVDIRAHQHVRMRRLQTRPRGGK